MKDNSKYLLLLNSDKINREFVNTTFKNEYKIQEFYSSKDVLKFVEDNFDNISAIICDLSISFDESFGFLVARKSSKKLQYIPVVAITKKDDNITIGAVKSQNVTYLIPAPLAGKDLARAISSITNRYKLDEERILEKYQSEISESKEDLTNVLNALDTGAYILELNELSLTPDLHVTFSNKKATEIFGSTDTSPESFFPNIPNEDQLKLLNTIKKAKDNFDRHTVEIYYGVNPEVQKKIRISIKRVYNFKSDAIRFICTVMDLTSETSMIIKANESEKLLDSIIDGSGVGVVLFRITMTDFDLVSANEAFCKLVGYDHIDLDLFSKIINKNMFKKMLAMPKLIFSNMIENYNEAFTYDAKLIKSNYTYAYVECKSIIYSFDGVEAKMVVLINDKTKDYKNMLSIKKLATFDEYTDFYKLREFNSICENMFQKHDEEKFTLLTIDLYNLRNIQSVFGKNKTDELLKVFSEGIKKIAKHTIKGKIEFQSYALCGLTKYINPEELKEQIAAYMKENYIYANVDIYYSVYLVDDPYVSMDTLILRSTYVLNQIKGSALNKIIYCDNKLRVRALQNDQIRNEMDDALKNGEFEIFLQPVYDIESKRIVSAEALSRWNHSKRGYISPSEYIPVFEENGFVVTLDNYVWKQVCLLIRSWIDNGKKVVPISVNVSRIDLFNLNFYDKITSLVNYYNIPPKYLRLEITESAYVMESSNIADIVKRLRDFGFTVLMDDFGSGYSSLNSLKDISIDILKIDMDLVRGMENNPRSICILKSVIELGTALKLQMICEGVETEKQATFIKECGCKNAQGWLYSKAIKINEFEEKLQKDGEI